MAVCAGARRQFRPKAPFSLSAMHVDEGDDATIRVAAGHDSEDGEQQHIRQLVELPLHGAGREPRSARSSNGANAATATSNSVAVL